MADNYEFDQIEQEFAKTGQTSNKPEHDDEDSSDYVLGEEDEDEDEDDDDDINISTIKVDIVDKFGHYEPAPVKNDGSQHKLNSTWRLWYHHTKNNWKRDGFKKIFDIKTIKDFWDIHNNFDKIGGIDNLHFFLMREDVQPMWEDAQNKYGGCWSFKIPVTNSYELWEQLANYMIGEMLTTDNPGLVTGMSVCLKNANTSVLQIWNNNSKFRSLNLLPKKIVDKYGYNIIYKAHIPEY
jgi:hypothetical protein